MDNHKQLNICVFEIGKILFSNSFIKVQHITEEMNFYKNSYVNLKNCSSYIKLENKYDLIIIAGTLDFFEKNCETVNEKYFEYSKNGKVIFVITNWSETGEQKKILESLGFIINIFKWNSLGSYKINKISLTDYNIFQLGIFKSVIDYSFDNYDFSNLKDFVRLIYIKKNYVESFEDIKIYFTHKSDGIINFILMSSLILTLICLFLRIV